MAQAFLESPLPEGPRRRAGGRRRRPRDPADRRRERSRPRASSPFPEPWSRRSAPHLPPFVGDRPQPRRVGRHVGVRPARLRAASSVPSSTGPGCDLALLFGGYALYDDAPRRRSWRGAATETGKPILLHDLYADEDAAGPAAPARAPAAALRLGRRRRARGRRRWRGEGEARRARRRSRPRRPATPPPPRTPGPLVARALAAARGRRERALLEDEAARLLAHFGVPVLPARSLARDADEARRRRRAPRASRSCSRSTRPPSSTRPMSGACTSTCARPTKCGGPIDAVGPLVGGRPRCGSRRSGRGGLEALVGRAPRPAVRARSSLFGAGGVLAESARDSGAAHAARAPSEELRGDARRRRASGQAPRAAARRAGPVAAAPVVTRVLRSLARSSSACPRSPTSR